MTMNRFLRTMFGGIAAVAVAALSANSMAANESENHERASSTSDDVERGRYVVKIAGCNDCHTENYALKAGAVNESQWLTGSSVGWQGPWGTTYPSNLRRLMQDLTEEQWLHHARQPTRPPMPWFALRDMSDEDLTAIYRFVRSLGPGGSPAPAFEPPQQPSTATTVTRWRAE